MFVRLKGPQTDIDAFIHGLSTTFKQVGGQSKAYLKFAPVFILINKFVA